MIKSLTFDGNEGYITSKIEPPHCSVRGYGTGWNRFSEEEKEKIRVYEEKYKEWEENDKGKYSNPQLVKNLIGRKFEFEGDKINLLFGPNASGKTTIIKAIAGKAMTTDGFPQLRSPLDISAKIDAKYNKATLDEYILGLQGNSATIEWDGAPVYYDNFANRRNYGSIGDLAGSVLGNDVMTEILYAVSKDKISLGQNSIYLMNRLFAIAKEPQSYRKIFENYLDDEGHFCEKKVRVNKSWAKVYKLQLDYLLGFEKSSILSPITCLFDEIDKSLDIVNIHTLYTTILPDLVKNTGIQIIIVSHSPLVLSDAIRNNEMYNFISLDEEYTQDCLNKIGNLFGTDYAK